MEKFKVGIIGLGCRGNTMGMLVAEHENCAITAICDEYQDRCDAMKEKLAPKGHDPKIFLNYEELIASPDVEMVFVFSAWENHVPAAVAAMRAKKPVAFEVGGAYTIDECIQLCKAHRETGTPAMMLENCCYGRVEQTLYSMNADGFFGELVQLCGGYCHDLREEISMGLVNRHYRHRNYRSRNCENYPTHELGPIAKALNINRGNRMLTLTSMASKASTYRPKGSLLPSNASSTSVSISEYNSEDNLCIKRKYSVAV